MSLGESLILSVVGFGVVIGILGLLALFIKAMARAVYKKEQAAAPAPVKEIVKEEDLPFLAQSAYDDACRPGNPKETSVEDITALYKSLL